MKKIIFVFVILIVVISLVATRYVASQIVNSSKKTDTIQKYLAPTDPNWIKLYGDTLENRIIYNIALTRYDQMQMYKMIQAINKKPDANEIKK